MYILYYFILYLVLYILLQTYIIFIQMYSAWSTDILQRTRPFATTLAEWTINRQKRWKKLT